MLCSGPQRYRWFFNLGIFRPQGCHVLPQRLWCSFGWHFAPSFERLDCQVERANWTEVSESPNKSCECDSRRESTFRTSAELLWCETNCAKKPDGGRRPIAVGNILRLLSAKCAGYHVFESRQARYGSRQVGVCTKRGAELASHVFRCLIERPQPKKCVFLKIDFQNAFISINRQFTLEKTFETHPEVYKYSHSAYSQPSFLFYGDSVIKSCKGTQQGDRESPASFSNSIQDLIDSFEPKTNLWYFDDGNLSDDYSTVLKDLKKLLKRKKRWDSKLNPRNVIFFLGDITEKRRSTILASFQKLCPGIKTPKKDELIILGSPLGPNSQADLLEKKIKELEKENRIVEKLDAHYGFSC